ncbi:MAG: hypothetical protein ACE5FD_17770, partial [Anaerolineae bacterium]
TITAMAERAMSKIPARAEAEAARPLPTPAGYSPNGHYKAETWKEKAPWLLLAVPAAFMAAKLFRRRS